MGNYAVTVDVERLLDTMGIDFDTAVEVDVTTADVDAWIADYEDAIDSILVALGYTTIPVTGNRDKNALGAVIAKRVAAQVYEVRYHGQEFPAWIQEWIKQYDLYIESLERGRRRLLDQSPATPLAGVITIGSAKLTSVHPDYRDGEYAPD